MKLKTEELRKFLSVAGQIKPNPVATNLDSIKIECTGQEVIFTKTNQNIWVKYSYVCQPCAPESYLINERMLNGVAITTKEYEVNINLHIDGNVLIISGEDVVKTTAQDLQVFPPIQEAKGERVKISKELVERIRIAAKYISTAVNRTAMNFVQVGMSGIFASNGSILYYYNAFPLPEVFLDQEPLNTIKGIDDVLYWTSESYDFFQIEGFTFGFIKSVVKPIPYMPIVQQTGTDNFTCKRQDFIDFCTLVQYSKKQDPALATLSSVNEQTLKLHYQDADFNIDINRNVAITCNAPVTEFRFSVEWVEVLLKSLPYNSLTFIKLGEGHYGVTTTEDENYKGIIARLA